MKPHLLFVPLGPNQSFSVRHDIVPFFLNRLHYHAEIELIHIVKGKGTQFIGDSIHHFNDGDVVLVGSNLPHYWKCDDMYFQNNTDLNVEAKVVHFSEDLWGEKFLELPENKVLNDLYKKSSKGILITGKTKEKVIQIIDKMLLEKNMKRVLLLLEVLESIANSNEYSFLSSSIATNNYNEAEAKRLNNIYQYSLANFKKKITLEEIADVANISTNSFCRYFKTKTQKTYSQYLIETRVLYSCKLLIENKLTISGVCYESGFNNFSNFNKFFKSIVGKSPLQYKKEFTK
ncbi:MAG: helix-turn-helix domain-containing protein [Sphingobacteriales bacterium]|nr:MAG: helix-turn-helix domain-containing protein [Sphingobacteriales bacterium]TAF81878.1 MAG: helix-turn-helix domain-containing protein [Sphingobacteriales bacterium]